jgi:ribosome-associated toxin RatA of RatAB toxin-antitoxin module
MRLLSRQHSPKILLGLLGFLITTVTTNGFAPHAFAQVQLTQAPLTVRIAAARSLKPGEIIFQGSQGSYIGYTVVQGDIKTLWDVLTDYDNFEKYMPNVVDSKILANQGNSTTFEQTQLFQILFFSRRSRTKIVVEESYPQNINFRVVEGEVKSLEGSWKVEPLGNNKFLLTHAVNVEPDIKSGSNRNLFFSIYEDTMEKTLKAIQVETSKRSQP